MGNTPSKVKPSPRQTSEQLVLSPQQTISSSNSSSIRPAQPPPGSSSSVDGGAASGGGGSGSGSSYSTANLLLRLEGPKLEGSLERLSISELRAFIDVAELPLPEGKLEKSDLVARARCLGPLNDLRPAQLKRLIEATAHEHTGCVEKGDLVACLQAAIETGGKAARAQVAHDEREQARRTEREVAEEMSVAACRKHELWRAEETAKARALLAAAEEEERKELEERAAADAERRWLDERKHQLQMEAASKQVQLLEARLALEREQQNRSAIEKEQLERRLELAKKEADMAHAAGVAQAAETQLAKLRLDEQRQQVEQLTAQLDVLQHHSNSLQQQQQQPLQQSLSSSLSAEDEALMALYAEADQADPERAPPATQREAPPQPEAPPAAPDAQLNALDEALEMLYNKHCAPTAASTVAASSVTATTEAAPSSASPTAARIPNIRIPRMAQPMRSAADAMGSAASPASPDPAAEMAATWPAASSSDATEALVLSRGKVLSRALGAATPT